MAKYAVTRKYKQECLARSGYADQYSHDCVAAWRRRSGFSIVEAILSISLLGLLMTMSIGAFVYGQQSVSLAGTRGRGVALAREGLDAVRNIRDHQFTNLSDGSYGLAISGNQWMFSGTQDVSGVFTRTVTISSIDTKRKKVVSTVTWPQTPQGTGSVSLTTYLTRWMISWSSPVQSGIFNMPGAQDGLKVQVQGNYAYVVRNDSTPDFLIVNISDPSSPSITGSLTLAGVPTNIAVQGNYAYVSSQDNSRELQIIDISNPAAPFVAGLFNAPGTANANGVAVSGSVAYLVRTASSDDELIAVNVVSPSSPSSLDSINLPATGREVTVAGLYAYIASESNSQELEVADISSPSSLNIVGTLNLSGSDDAVSVAAFGSTAVIGRMSSGLFIINISTPSAPILMSSLSVGGDVNDIAMGNSDTYAFLATSAGSGEFWIIDIINPALPSAVSSLSLGGTANGVAYDTVEDRAIIVTSDNSGELVIASPQ